MRGTGFEPADLYRTAPSTLLGLRPLLAVTGRPHVLVRTTGFSGRTRPGTGVFRGRARLVVCLSTGVSHGVYLSTVTGTAFYAVSVHPRWRRCFARPVRRFKSGPTQRSRALTLSVDAGSRSLSVLAPTVIGTLSVCPVLLLIDHLSHQ